MRRLLSAPPVVLRMGHLHPWVRCTERGSESLFSLEMRHFLFFGSVSQYSGQCDTHLYFSALAGDQKNICTSAFGISGSSVLSMGWSLQWLCEGRVWIKWGSRRTRRPIWTSLSTNVHATTELLCLLFDSCYYDLISHLSFSFSLSLKCSSHRPVFRSEFHLVQRIPVSCLMIRTRT